MVLAMAPSHIQLSAYERAEASVSHTAIAAVLARTDLAMGERLVALSLASFANRDDRAFPGNAAAAARAGLGRSRYLEARDQLVARGLVAIESAGRGRGQSTTLISPVREVRSVVGRRDQRAPARAACSATARPAGPRGCCSRRWPPSPTSRASVDELSTDDLCRAAGLANSTYRRARTALLASGEVELVDDGGGRGRMNRWRVLAAAGGLSTASGSAPAATSAAARPATAPLHRAI